MPPARVVRALIDAGLAQRKVYVRTSLLGRLEGVGFRLRDDVRVYDGTLEELATHDTVWSVLQRGVIHEVRDMELRVVGPPKRNWWSSWN